MTPTAPRTPSISLAPAAGPLRPVRGRGFTLIELALVVLILGFSVVMVISNFGDLIPDEQLRSESERIASLLEMARSSATARGVNFALVYDLDKHEYWVLMPRSVREDEQRKGKVRGQHESEEDGTGNSVGGAQLHEHPAERGETLAVIRTERVHRQTPGQPRRRRSQQETHATALRSDDQAPVLQELPGRGQGAEHEPELDHDPCPAGESRPFPGNSVKSARRPGCAHGATRRRSYSAAICSQS